MADVLDTFLAPTRAWFRQRYGAPTPPQELGWPAIQRGENTLILSPTGSGKTLTAFLWGIDRIFAHLGQAPEDRGVQLLYISPLKALNNDIERNLREPLAGIRATARRMETPLPALHMAVRTGDTPQSARQSMVRQPPHILITTPESLYLILGSEKARDILRTVRTVIVDEIHTLSGNKRGVHLALSLERLERLIGGPVQRIGLSATQRPLEEVASFLVGQEWEADEAGGERLASRPVTIVNAGTHKDLDLRVVTVVPDLRRLPGGSIWPSLIPDVLEEVRRHRTTLIFTNSRRGAERAADRLNEQYAVEEDEEVPPGSPSALLRDNVPVGEGMFGTGRSGGPFRAHHGSVSREVRLELEQQLKEGRLPALVATSSLELGIDIGEVDEVVQLQSPRGIARGLQRVGRAGHLVGQTSVGRIYATHREDLLDAAAVAHGMMNGDIEPTYTPRNCLDVLAQQIVAMVAMEDWAAEDLYHLVRQAYGYQELPADGYRAVLKMLSGGYPSEVFHELRPRISWDRVNDRLAALPGSRLLAIRNGGTIADRGQYNVYLADGKTALGTLDEEFIFETRVGDIISLGSNTWRVMDIAENRVTVADAAGNMPRMPFWRGEAPKRDYHLGLRLGAFRHELAERVAALPPLPDDAGDTFPEEALPIIDWLANEYALDGASARNALIYVRQQLAVIGDISSDHTIIAELFHDALGDQRLVVHSCFGARINSAWALALSHAFQEQMHHEIEVQVNDDGILFRFVQADREPPLDVIRNLGPDEARERLLQELPNSAMFGAQFRMNSARALLLPGVSGAHGRTPFWLQRLRARDLLAAVKGYDDFPMVVETYRDVLRDVLDLEHLMEMLGGIQRGEIKVVEAHTIVPSPLASGLLFDLINVGMYEDDTPKVDRQIQALALNRELLAQLLDEDLLPDLLRPEAVAGVEAELQHLAEGYFARSAEELALMLHDLGDLSAEEVAARCSGEGRAWLLALAGDDRACELPVPAGEGPASRWIAAEDYWRYRDAFGLPAEPPVPLPEELLNPVRTAEAASETLLRLYARTHGPFTRDEVAARYAFDPAWLDAALDELVENGQLVAGRLRPATAAEQWCDRRVLERIHRRTLSVLRKEIQPVDLAAYADFMLRWQGLDPAGRRPAEAGIGPVLQQLRGVPAHAAIWERDLLPLRLADYAPAELDALTREGELVWAASGSEAAHARLRFFFRGEGTYLAAPEAEGDAEEKHDLSEAAAQVADYIREEGACYTQDLRRGLDLAPADLDGALVELVLAGEITNDHLDAMRRILAGDWQQATARHGLRSSLDEQLGAWRAQRAPTVRRPPAGRLRQARRAAVERAAAPTPWSGRWSLLSTRGIRGREVAPAERVAYQARQLLQRYGIVTRECLENEEGPWDWPSLYQYYQLLEMRGEVRRGYFVRGLPGVQFALPEAVEQLRRWNGEGQTEDEEEAPLVLVNACDPALIYGPALGLGAGSPDAGLPEERNPYRFARLPSNYVVLRRGVPVLLYEHGGGRWITLPRQREATIREAVRLCLTHLVREGGLCARPRRVLVRAWNGEPPIGSLGQPLLEMLGFRREAPAMVWDGL